MKKFTKTFLFALITCLFSVTASAYDLEVDGIYYKILSLEDLKVEVTKGDNNYTGDVVIPSIITYNSENWAVISIGDGAFWDCSSLTSIGIGDSVASIGVWAFHSCSSLTSIVLPNSVTSIGGSAFEGCSSLTGIEIPNSVTSINDGAFNGCSSLRNLRIENGTTTLSLGYNSLYSPESYGKGLFYDCPLVSLHLGRNLSYNTSRYSGYSPFASIKSLTTVTIGDSVTSIGEFAFSDCSSLTSIEIPNSVTSIGEDAFCGCSSLTSIEIPNSVDSIGDWAFSACSSLGTIRVDESNPKYDSRNNCNAIIKTENDTLIVGCKNTIIHRSVTSIGISAFDGCSSLTSIEIPNSVTSIGHYAFWGCTSLTNLHFEDGATTLSFNLSHDGSRKGLFNDCPLESLHLGRNLFCQGDFFDDFPDYSYDYSPFAKIRSLTSVTIGDSVISIGDGAFWDCSNLTSIEIGNSVDSIGENAFSLCSNLTSIEIPNSVTSIGGGAFKGCSNLTSIYMQGTIPPSVHSQSFTTEQYLLAILYVPNGSLATYQSAEIWKKFQNIKEYDATGIDDISADDIETKFTGNGISVPNAVGKAVYVYSVNGAVVKKFAHYDGSEITLDNGTYIIRIGEKAIKVQL